MDLNKPTHWRTFSATALLLGTAWIWLTAALWSPAEGTISAPQQGFLAPDFTLQTLDGETITLSELRGQAVLVNLWASWCVPCRAEMPAMQRVYDEYKGQGFVVLAVNVTSQDSASAAAAFVRQYGLNFPILLDVEGSVSRAYEQRAFPTSFFIGRDGVIREVVIGGPMAEALLRTRVESLLAEGN